MHVRWSLVAATLALNALAAPADDVTEGTRLIRSVQDEQAVLLLTRSLDRGDGTPRERAQIHGLLAIARFNLRDEEGARLSFRKALEADPTYALPRLGSPRVRAAFDEERAAWATARLEPKPLPAPVAEVPLAVKVTPSPASTATGWPARRWVGLGAGVAGVAAAVVGGVFVAQSSTARERAVAEPDALAAEATFKQAQGSRQTGWVLVGLGAGLAVSGAAVALWPISDDARVVIGPGTVSVIARF